MNEVRTVTTIFTRERSQPLLNTFPLEDETRSQEKNVINLYPHKKYQTWEGFGGALTESAAYVWSRMSEEKQSEILDAFYGENGLRYTWGRLHMDSCDFSLSMYSAASSPDGPFLLDRDRLYVIPLIRAVQEKAFNGLRLIMAPWSPPAYMKSNGARNGAGHLMPEYYQGYADYIAKYLTEYRRLGIEIDCFSVQNEPMAVQIWDACVFTPEEEKVFLRDHLYPTLRKNGFDHIQIYIWDHNKEHAYEWVNGVVDGDTEDMVHGVCLHWYSGDHFEQLSLIREDYPELKLMHSEGCVELACESTPAGTPVEQAKRYAHDMIGDMNHGLNSWIDWNLVLDMEGGPNHVGNYCAAPILCDAESDMLEYQRIYDAIAHFSRFIQNGARRIASSGYTSQQELVAFENPDGSIAAVLLNQLPQLTEVHLRIAGRTATVKVPGNSLTTLQIG